MQIIDSLTSSITDFGTRATVDGDRLVLTLRGTADTDAKPTLDTVLSKVHDEAVEREAATVLVDLRQVEFMNSTCLKSFLTWLRPLRDSDAYKVELRSSARIYWQRRSMEALVSFAPEIVTHAAD